MRMRVLVIAALLLALLAAPCRGWAQSDPIPVEMMPAQPAPADHVLPIVVGLGAIAGVIGFNLLALGVEALPGGFAYAAGATVPAEMSVAMNRVYAVTSAVVGGWVAYYFYAR
ncbi:MAG: hypothetical protein U1E53_17155 [Dongiaceae bacterium]